MESESNRKQWAITVGKAALALFSRYALPIMLLLILMVMMPIFVGSLKEVEELVDAGVVPKPLFEFIISSVGLCVIMFYMSLKTRR